MIYVGYATPLADATTFLRFILNPRRPEGSPVPMLSTPAEEISDPEAMKLYRYINRYIISVLEKPGKK